MESKIIKQEKNPFLQREEFVLEITSEAAPSASEVIANLGKDEALTVVKKINTNFGQQKFLVEVVVYDNAEAKEKVEVIPQKVRKKMEAERKAEEEARKKAEAEAKAAEEAAKAEEAKEEEKVEEAGEEVEEENKEGEKAE